MLKSRPRRNPDIILETEARQNKEVKAKDKAKFYYSVRSKDETEEFEAEARPRQVLVCLKAGLGTSRIHHCRLLIAKNTVDSQR
jgi:hypothetical protein